MSNVIVQLKQNELIYVGIERTTIRKLLGIPLGYLILALFGTALVGASVLYFSIISTLINVDPAAVFTSNNLLTLDATAGNNYTFYWTLKNNADKTLSFDLLASMNHTNLTTGEIMLQLYYLNGSQLVESDVASGGFLNISVIDVNLYSGEQRNGTVIVQLNSSADPGNYSLNIASSPGSYLFN